MIAGEQGRWTPLNDNHAIAVVAAVVLFAEPLPNLIFKKILDLSEEATKELGLTVKQNFAVPLGMPGPANVSINIGNVAALNGVS